MAEDKVRLDIFSKLGKKETVKINNSANEQTWINK